MQSAHGKIGVWLNSGRSSLYCYYIHGLDGGFLLFDSKSFFLLIFLVFFYAYTYITWVDWIPS